MGRLRTPWTSQPQTAVGIDSSNPITRGLVFALNAANRRDSISGATAVLSGTSYQAVGLAGISHKSPTTQVPGAFTYTVNIASAFDCTTVVVFRSVTAQAAYHYVPTLNFNSAEPVVFSSTGSQSVFSTTGNASTTITTLSAGRVYVLAGVKRVNSQEQYVNGVKVTTDVTGNRAVGAITTVSVGRPSGGNNVENAEYYEVLHFNRALSPHEVAVLSANPWQVFAPLERRIWAPAAGGGTTITGTIGTAVASGFTGTVNANRTIAGALGTATASGFRGVVNANRTISGALGTAVASGLAGNVNANRTIASALGTATASGFQGAVTNGNTTTIAGSLGTAVASGFTGGISWNRYIAGVIGVATASGFTGGVANGASSGGDGGTSKRKYYIRRRKQILIFDSVAQVDAYIEAEEEAAVAIAKAKSRGAKKRAIARVFKEEQPEAVEITPLAELIESYKLPYNVGELIASENYQQIVDIQRIIQRIRDDEDEELLLLLA